MRVCVLMAASALLIAACGAPAEEAATEPTQTTALPATTSTQQTATTTTALAPTEMTMPDETEMIQAAIKDLSRRLLTPEETIDVVETRSVEWPDGSIGCPEEGIVYTQATIQGTQVLLGSDGKIYDYHAGDDGEIFLCPSDEKDGAYEFVPPPGFDR